MPPRFGLPLHLLSTVGIVCLAAGLGELAGAADESLPSVPVAVGLWGGAFSSTAIALILFVPVGWQLLYARVASVPASARR